VLHDQGADRVFSVFRILSVFEIDFTRHCFVIPAMSRAQCRNGFL
jgi:hypothetical protein